MALYRWKTKPNLAPPIGDEERYEHLIFILINHIHTT